MGAKKFKSGTRIVKYKLYTKGMRIQKVRIYIYYEYNYTCISEVQLYVKSTAYQRYINNYILETQLFRILEH